MRALLLLLLALPASATAQTWTTLPPMLTPRADPAVAVLDGRLYVMGGTDASGTVLESAERYDPATDRWEFIGELRDARTSAAAALHDGGILLIGGREDNGEATDDTEWYDPGDDDWNSFDNLPTEREGLGAVALGGIVYAIGGTGRNGVLLSSCEALTGDDWMDYPFWSVSPPRAEFGVAAVDGAVLLAGGFSTFGPLDRVERYVPGSGATLLAPLPLARGALAFAATATHAWAIGGRDAGDAVRAEVHRLDIAANEWSAGTALPEAREGARAVILGEDLVVVGGRDAFGTPLASAITLRGITTDREGGPDADALALKVLGAHPSRGPLRLGAEVDRPGPASVRVYDVRGRLVATLADRDVAGPFEVTWGEEAAPGIYLARLETPEGSATLRVTIAR